MVRLPPQAHHQCRVPEVGWWDRTMDPWDEDAGASRMRQLWGRFHGGGCSQAMSRDLLKDNTIDHPLAQVLLAGYLTFTAMAKYVFHAEITAPN